MVAIYARSETVLGNMLTWRLDPVAAGNDVPNESGRCSSSLGWKRKSKQKKEIDVVAILERTEMLYRL